MSGRALRTTISWVLVVLSIFLAVSAVGGGVGMIVADGLSMPKAMLADTPFTTYTIPGLILVLVVGGTQAVAAAMLLARRESSLLWSAVAGFGMVIWILIEVAFIHALMWAQIIYLVSGLTQLILVYALLGIVSWLPREHPVPPRRSLGGASRPRGAVVNGTGVAR